MSLHPSLDEAVTAFRSLGRIVTPAAPRHRHHLVRPLILRSDRRCSSIWHCDDEAPGSPIAMAAPESTNDEDIVAENVSPRGSLMTRCYHSPSRRRPPVNYATCSIAGIATLVTAASSRMTSRCSRPTEDALSGAYSFIRSLCFSWAREDDGQFLVDNISDITLVACARVPLGVYRPSSNFNSWFSLCCSPICDTWSNIISFYHSRIAIPHTRIPHGVDVTAPTPSITT